MPKVTHSICTTVEGTLDEVLSHPRPEVPELGEVLGLIKTLLFVIELTPSLAESDTVRVQAARAREILAALGG